MTGDARRALTRLLNAFENHFDIARDGDEADDAALEAAELALRQLETLLDYTEPLPAPIRQVLSEVAQ